MSPSLEAILGPPAQPPAYSLLVAATTPGSSPDRWQMGVTWAPEQMGGGGSACAGCKDDVNDSPDSLTNPVRGTAEPITVWAEDHCSTLGYGGRDYEARARRQLEATQSYFIANELQLGTLRTSCSLENVALVDGVHVGTGLFSVVDAIALLEEALARAFKGRRGMIHMSPKLFTLAKQAYVIDLVGQRWQTPSGTIVAMDAGYQTIGGVDWMYATSMMQILLSPALVPMNFQQATDRQLNDVKFYAERLALVTFDATEATTADHVFKIEVDAPFGAGS